MEIKKNLNVPAAFFYGKVLDSIRHDVRTVTGKSLTEKQLNGFSYDKVFSKDQAAKIIIDELVPNSSYQYRTLSVRNEFVCRYDIQAIDDNHCMVTYKESMTSNGTFQKLNDMFTGILLGFFKKRRFKKMLTMIEESY
ncbi:hypothetical protein M2139_001395 [Enterococcus sp. PF1-24]|uniref:DUF3284 domain-containing protein n=1 Tax=unclassified Enterococcus TaxID=2608891 RepID=UPI00247430DB|nr:MULTISPECIES: DUF3284 domain-containing protein [unclassified Enterococcus]MDH6364466.1 hypothetical protein [Enterococcus sp. PFB1-1]MDH6401511.1 hypothetical protein [Enterococcus sp. PF1-24]